jgi:hypothetical protein
MVEKGAKAKGGNLGAEWLINKLGPSGLMGTKYGATGMGGGLGYLMSPGKETWANLAATVPASYLGGELGGGLGEKLGGGLGPWGKLFGSGLGGYLGKDIAKAWKQPFKGSNILKTLGPIALGSGLFNLIPGVNLPTMGGNFGFNRNTGGNLGWGY